MPKTINMQVDPSDRRITVLLHEKLLRDAKVHAAREGMTLRKVVAIALSDYLIRNKKRD